MTQTQRPSYRAFVVIKREGQDDFWLPIGAAFKHSGDGFNVILQALPISDGDGTCKIVLRPPKDDTDDKNETDERTRQAVRQTNDQRKARSR
jgi:hypothetical protein